jgi:hypothetical protein
MDLIWVKAEAENFLKWDWTGGIILIRFNKFRRARKSETAGSYASRDADYAGACHRAAPRTDPLGSIRTTAFTPKSPLIEKSFSGAESSLVLWLPVPL